MKIVILIMMMMMCKLWMQAHTQPRSSFHFHRLFFQKHPGSLWSKQWSQWSLWRLLLLLMLTILTTRTHSSRDARIVTAGEHVMEKIKKTASWLCLLVSKEEAGANLKLLSSWILQNTLLLVRLRPLGVGWSQFREAENRIVQLFT